MPKRCSCLKSQFSTRHNQHFTMGWIFICYAVAKSNLKFFFLVKLFFRQASKKFFFLINYGFHSSFFFVDRVFQIGAIFSLLGRCFQMWFFILVDWCCRVKTNVVTTEDQTVRRAKDLCYASDNLSMPSCDVVSFDRMENVPN